MSLLLARLGTGAAVIATAVSLQHATPAGRAFVQSGVQGPNVAPPVRNVIITRQEQPRHPNSFTVNALVRPNPPPTQNITTTQEQPLSRVGYSFTQPGVQGPNVRPPGDTVITKQEQPDFKTAFLQSGFSPTVSFKPEIKDFVFTRQEQPDHPKAKVSWALPDNPAGPPLLGVITRQEAPFHPKSFSWTGIYGVGVKTPAIDYVFTRQEQPRHPRPYIDNTFRVSSVGRVGHIAITKQEAPRHPAPFVRSTQLITVPVPGRTVNVVITKQELPFHPKSFTLPYKFISNAIPPLTDIIPPLQRNLTKDMLGKVVQTVFYTDPGFDQQIITSINYPMIELYVVGWTPVGGVKYPINNAYNLNPRLDPIGISNWYTDINVSGWKTALQNQTDDMIKLQNQTGFFVAPIEYQVNKPHAQFYVVGLMPVGMNISNRALVGILSYA